MKDVKEFETIVSSKKVSRREVTKRD